MCLLEGDIHEALAVNARARSLRRGPRAQLALWLDRMRILRWAGDLAGADDALQRARLLAEGMPGHPMLQRIRGEEVLLCVDRGDAVRARQVLETLLRDGSGPRGALLLAEAAVCTIEGDRERAVRILDQGEALSTAAGQTGDTMFRRDVSRLRRVLS